MYIFKYILKRIALMLFVFFVIVTMCFVLVKLLPNLPAEAFGKDMELILKRRELLGYDLPIMQQYGRFLKYAVRGNFGYGETYKLGSEVWQVFVNRLPYTMVLNLSTIVISIPLGLALGIFAALKKNKWQDHLISTGVMVFVSVPSFIYAFLVQYILYFKLGWFGAVSDVSAGAWSYRRLCTLYKSRAYRGFDQRLYAACQNQGSYQGAGYRSPCYEKCDGAYFPNDTW